jgi:tetratricopeptide (TPR) repeat protein
MLHALWEAEIEAARDNWHNLLDLSERFVLLRWPEQVLRVCDRGQTLAPWHPTFVINRGLAFWLQGRTHDAEAEFRRAIRLDPGSSARAHGQLARLLLTRGEITAAEREYEAAVAGETNAALRYALTGELLLRCRGDASGARAAFQAALARDRRLASASRGLAAATSLALTTPPTTAPRSR